MSEKYLYQEDISDDEVIQRFLRKKINSWANSIPHHPFQDLGDHISIESVWKKPAYPIRLLSQYEARTKDEAYKPYYDQEVSERVYFSLNDFNSWDITLSLIHISEPTRPY